MYAKNQEKCSNKTNLAQTLLIPSPSKVKLLIPCMLQFNAIFKRKKSSPLFCWINERKQNLVINVPDGYVRYIPVIFWWTLVQLLHHPAVPFLDNFFFRLHGYISVIHNADCFFLGKMPCVRCMPMLSLEKTLTSYVITLHGQKMDTC